MQDSMQDSMQTIHKKGTKEVNTKFKIDFDTNGTNKKIIADLAIHSLFQIDSEVQKDMETILKYDFNPKEENADYAVSRLYNYIVKIPEFQLI
jgi:D-hexose-6-phosphate mutarotase